MGQGFSTRGLAVLSSGMEDKTTAETKDGRVSDAEEQVTDEANARSYNNIINTNSDHLVSKTSGLLSTRSSRQICQNHASFHAGRVLVLSNQENEKLQAALDLAEVALGETNVDDAPDKLDSTVNNSARPMPSGCGPTPTAALIISCSAPHNERSHVISASRSRTFISLCWVIDAAAMVVITLSNGGVGGASD
ncbi:hypothetical protein CF319_g8491 [Tilletia indica]|nr:hypothetical protein CF319_g8491 [Tilletia indica]